MRTRSWILLLSVLPALGAAGCGGGTGVGGTTGSAEDLTFEAWDVYRKAAGDDSYASAQVLFTNALSLDPGFSEAHNGLGWVNLRRAGQIDDARDRGQFLEQSLINFERATAADPENVDAWAGKAGLELARENYSSAISAANKALELNPRYFSPHDNIDFRDLHLVLAESFFFEGSFEDGANSQDPNNAVFHLNQLDPAFSEAYANGLTPPDIVFKIEELQSE